MIWIQRKQISMRSWAPARLSRRASCMSAGVGTFALDGGLGVAGSGSGVKDIQGCMRTRLLACADLPCMHWPCCTHRHSPFVHSGWLDAHTDRAVPKGSRPRTRYVRRELRGKSARVATEVRVVHRQLSSAPSRQLGFKALRPASGPSKLHSLHNTLCRNGPL